MGGGGDVVRCHDHQGGSQDREHRLERQERGLESGPGSAPNSLWAPGQDTTVLQIFISPSYKKGY